VENAELIAVGGGNTFRLLEQLYEKELMDLLRLRVKEGVRYVGWSAGSNMAGLSIRTTNDMPIVEPESFDALALLPFQINPHYTEATIPDHGGETRAQRLGEFLELNKTTKVVALPEGTALQLKEGELSLLGERMKLFSYGEEAKYLDGSSDLGFLNS